MQCNFQTQFMFLTNYNAVPKEFAILYRIFLPTCLSNQRSNKSKALEDDSRMPKKTAANKCQIQNNLAPVLQYFVIDWNSNSDQNERKQWSKQRQKRAKIIIQTPTETNENNNPNSDRNDKGINVHTNETYGYLCCLSAREHFFHIRNKA